MGGASRGKGLMFPIHDWQFWVVTGLAIAALVFVLNRVVPTQWLPWKKKPKGRGTTLTIEGKPVSKKK